MWKYFENLGVEIYSDKEKFDGVHGLLGYNKTLQRSGKSNVVRNIDEWIITVGKHPGIISGETWVKAQMLLEQNTSKSYRKPRSHPALLSGLLVCGNCGSFMRPKMYNKDYEDGERRFSYLCETKEKSRQHKCNIKNPNGNVLDRAICEEIKKLSENSSEFVRQLESTKTKIKSNSEEIDLQIESLENSIADKKNQIANLVTSIAKTTGEAVADYINQRIEELDKEIKAEEQRLADLKKLTEENVLSDNEFDVLRDILSSFASSFDTMNIEQKRAAIRIFVKRIVWDGENIHMYLFGSEEDGILKEGSDTCAAPMYLHSFKFIAPRKVSEAQKFTLRFPDADKLEIVADKLRYHRYRKGLLQSDVADYLGIERSTYIDYENPDRDYYSAEVMEKIAELFCVDVYDLLDDYNKFLYDGQGENIKRLRKHLKITQEDLAKKMNVSLLKVKRWEQEEVRMFKFTWEKMLLRLIT